MSFYITRSKNYLEDLEKFSSNKDRINPKLRSQYENLIKKFKNTATIIDNEHSSSNKEFSPLLKSRESVTELAEVRKRLYKMINDLDK